MAKVQANDVVSRDYRGPDRRRSGPLGKLERSVIRIVRSRWLAMFVVAFAVSYGFQQVDNIGEHRVERQQRVIVCVIDGVAREQALTDSRVQVGAILQECEKQQGKE